MELVITDKGRQLIAKVVEGNETINFTKIKTSAYDYSGVDSKKLTDLKDIKQEALISSVEKISGTHVEVIGMINNSNLQEGYDIKAVGLYAINSDSEEILYGISIPDKYPDHMPAFENKTLSAISYKLITKVDNSEQVNIELNHEGVPNITQFNDLKKVVIETKEFINEHITKGILSEEGSHGLKYDEDELKLKYKKDDTWHDIPTGQRAENEINEHKQKSVLNSEGVHDFKCDGNEIFCYKNSNWINIDVTSKHRGVRVISGDGVHGIKFDMSDKRLKYKNNSNNWENIPAGQEVQENLTIHENKKISIEDGVHGVKYDESTKNIAVQKGMQWSPIEPHAKDIELIKYILCEKIVDNLFTIELDDVQVEGGCYDYTNKKYYINKSEE